MDPIRQFESERAARVSKLGDDKAFRNLSQAWLSESMQKMYVYNFSWLGRPIIQYPQDIVAVQEIVWATRPDLIIETGVAHGGSLILSASLLALLDLFDAEAGDKDPRSVSDRRQVIGIDIDIRQHNRDAIESHPLANRIKLIQGSSIASETVTTVKKMASGFRRVMVCLDSMHTHDHVLAELHAYADLVTPSCYCVVFDSFVEDMSPGFFANRPWDVGNNPKTAVHQFLSQNTDFCIDKTIEHKLGVTVAPDGFLIRGSGKNS